MFKNLSLSIPRIYFFLFFLSLVISNFFINLFITLSFIFYFKKINIKELLKNKTICLVIFYFIFIFINAFFHDPINLKNFTIIRFLFIILLIFSIKNIINFENDLKNICLLFLLFISFDLIFQNLFEYDLFGFEKTDDALTGPFRDELAGSFLSKLWIFSGLYILNNKNYKQNLFYFIIILTGIILASERMALFHFVSITAIFLLIFILSNNKNTSKFCVIFSLILVLIISLNVDRVKVQLIGKTLNQIGFNKLSYILIANTDLVKNSRSLDSYDEIEKKKAKEVLKDIYSKYNIKYHKSIEFAYLYWGYENIKFSSPHAKLFNSAKLIYKENFYFGTGVKTFQKQCDTNIKIINDPFNFQCSTHPHNLHIQILQETGFVGYIFFLLVIIWILYFSFKNFLLNKNLFHLGYLIGLILFLLPLPSGNFFGTWPSSYFWFIISLNIYKNENLSMKKI